MKYLNFWSLLTVIVASFGMMIANATPTKVALVEEISVDAEIVAAISHPLPQTVFSEDVLKEVECLAKNIYKEAGYEPWEGKIAVAQVTINRVEHIGFPNTVCGVVYEKTRNRHTGKMTTCQFSWYCDPVHRNRPVHQPTYEQSYEVAKQVLLDDVRLPGLENAIFYHATYIDPRWNYSRITTIGQHIFYEARPRVVLASR
jgi:spore germination cell wall hydrolase CwlJ-like protein